MADLSALRQEMKTLTMATENGLSSRLNGSSNDVALSSGRSSSSSLRFTPFQKLARVTLRFKLPFSTQWGENLVVSGSDPIFGSWNVKQGVWMNPHHEDDLLVWQAVVSVPERFSFQYKYCVVDEKYNVIKWETAIAGSRQLTIPSGLPDGAVVDILDIWQDCSSPETLLSRAAFRKVIFGKGEEEEEVSQEEAALASSMPSLPAGALDPDNVVVSFRIHCSRLEAGQRVCVTGSVGELGAFESAAAVPLVHMEGNLWQLDISLPRTEFPLRYKYLLRDEATGSIVPSYGSDHELPLDTSARKPLAMVVVSDNYFQSVPWRGAGLATPIFSIRTESSCGVGEFLDVKLLVDLAVKAGLHLVQILPINDTSVHGMWWDSYPYSAISVLALHPLYLRLDRLSDSIPPEIQAEIDSARNLLNPLKDVDYEATMGVKLSVARKMFELEGSRMLASSGFQTFFEENKVWLRPYAAFCFLKSLFGTADHTQWGVLGDFSEKKLDELTSPSADHYRTICFRYYLQYHLHLQLLEAAEYARVHGVVLKGDLPIGVDKRSCDTWQNPRLFRMDTSTGAPPDAFSPGGQNWGFPTYNWEEMALDNYAWWRLRLGQMAKYFSAYRIDHILGLFRIWELPAHAVTGLCGRFRPAIPITQEEMEAHGLWDFDRLSLPYIRGRVLIEALGPRWQERAAKFLVEHPVHSYLFREEYRTESAIAAALTPREGSPAWLIKELEETQQGLFTLLQNRSLLRDPQDPRKYHPRFDMEKTSNFLELDEHSKNVLRNLYKDYFFQRQEALWRESALRTLPVMMNATDMLTCGEDLGLVPACVPPVLQELGLLGLRIQRMPTQPGQEFANPADYDYMTVCSPSCHDTTTMRGWWEEDPARRTRFFRSCLGFASAPPDLCDPDVSRTIVQQHMDCPSVWAIFPMQDLLALKAEYSQRPAAEETINDPTNPRHYWRFRLHVAVEQLLEDEDWVGIVQDLVLSSQRSTSSDLAKNSAQGISKGASCGVMDNGGLDP